MWPRCNVFWSALPVTSKEACTPEAVYTLRGSRRALLSYTRPLGEPVFLALSRRRCGWGGGLVGWPRAFQAEEQSAQEGAQMLLLSSCEICHQLRLRGPHRSNSLIHHLQPTRRKLYEGPPAVRGIGDAAHQSRAFEAIDTIGHRPGREHTGAIEGRWGELEWRAGTAQGAQHIEQFPGQAIGFEDGVDPAVHQVGEALEATEDGQRRGIKVRADLLPLSHNTV